MTEDKTTIQLSKNTKAELDKLGKKGETYNAILERSLKRISETENKIEIEKTFRKRLEDLYDEDDVQFRDIIREWFFDEMKPR